MSAVRLAFSVVVLFMAVMSVNSIGSGAQPAPGTQVEQKVNVGEVDGKPIDLRYWLFLPKSYSSSGPKQPFLLFLHGAGERGDQLDLVKVHGPPKIVDKKPDFQFIVASPQCPKGERWDAKQLGKLVDSLCSSLNVDQTRLYVSGLSMGGYGTWALIAEYPDRFAAAVPICGGGDPATAERLKNTPFWVFHGAKDTAVPLSKSEEMVNALEGVKGKAKLTVYPEAAHDSWTETYNNPAVYEWLLSHKRS